MAEERTKKRYNPIRRNCVNIDDPEFSRRPKDGHGFIYRYHFIKSRKDYIGQTIQTMKKRLSGHRSHTSKVDMLIRSGAVFTMEILSEVDIRYIDDAERYCISKFGTLYPNGYNVIEGGQDKRTYLPIVRESISRSLKEYYSEHRTEMLRQTERMRVNNKRVKVVCLETGKIYDTIESAGRDVNARSSNIRRVMMNCGVVKGYHFIAYSKSVMDDIDTVLLCIIDYEKEMRSFYARKNANSKPRSEYKPRSNSYLLKCIETGKIYSNIKQASVDLGICSTLISRVILGERKTTHGYHFEKVMV